MVKAIPWITGIHLFLLIAAFLYLGRVDIDDVSW